MQAIRLGVVLVLCLGGIGCQPTTKGGNTEVGKASKPFVVAIPTYPGFAIPFLAKSKGLFQGITVELKRVDDAAAINAGLIRGDIDACFTSTDAFVLASSQGVEAQAVLMSDESRGADGVVVKRDINSFTDLKGKKVAANLGWPGHFLLLYNLKKEGIPFADITITNMDADKSGAAFVSGNLDAAVTWEPWLSKATSEADGKILVSTATLPGVIVDVMLVREGTVKDRPGDIQAFVKGYYDALQFYQSNTEEASKIMADALGLKTEEFKAMTQGFRFITAEKAFEMLSPDNGAVVKLFAEADDIWLKAGVIEKKVSNTNRVTNRFVESSVRKK